VGQASRLPSSTRTHRLGVAPTVSPDVQADGNDPHSEPAARCSIAEGDRCVECAPASGSPYPLAGRSPPPSRQSCSARRLPGRGASVPLAVGQASACHAFTPTRPIRLGATPYRFAGRSLRPSWASLTRMCLRSGIHACAGHIRRLNGRGNPSPTRSRMSTARRPPTAQQRTPRADKAVATPSRMTSVI
jgi:hypothetical protein